MNEDMKQDPQDEQPREEQPRSRMDSMLKGLREFGQAAMEKAEEFGKLASEKAEELTRLGKIKLDIHQLNRSRIKVLADLGRLTYTLNEADKLSELADQADFNTLKESIAELDKEIAEKEAEAAKVADEEGDELTVN